MPRIRPEIGLAFALVGLPTPARGDAFVPPQGKTAVEVTVALENLGDYPQYLFVLWPDGCLHDEESFASYTVLNVAEDDGRSELHDEGCVQQRLFAFPSDTYALVDGALPEVARRQLSDEPPTDPRVLVRPLAAEELWWVPDAVELRAIEDVYRVAIEAGVLTLTPTRVRFDFGDGRIFDRPFYKGRRPRLPRVQDIPPAPPPPTAGPASAEAPADAAPTPAPPPPPAQDVRPPAPVRGEISGEPWPPPPVVYGGLCLLVALGAGLALRRR